MAARPRPPFRFIREEHSGTTAKIWVRDRAGRTWIVKWGKEVPADVFAPRLAWVLGYHATPTYFVRSGRVVGVRVDGRARSHIAPNGRFQNARFKLVDTRAGYVRGGWRWDDNPFLATAHGRRQLNGLKILMLLVSNWDAKDTREGDDANTAIFVRKGVSMYAVDDWGASLGGWGGYFNRDKWDCDEFAEQNDDFIKGVSRGGVIEWGYRGKHRDDLTSDITVADVRWLVPRLRGLTTDRLAAGLRSSGAMTHESRCLARSLRARIDQLVRIASLRRAERRESRGPRAALRSFFRRLQ